MKKALCLLWSLLIVLVAPPRQVIAASPDGPCGRIVSLAPSIDEVLFELGLGSKVVGVTRFSAFPMEVQNVARIGGFLDVNREAVVALAPSLIVALDEHGELIPQFQALGLKIEVVSHTSVRGILKSIQQLARLCGVEERGRSVVTKLEKEADDIAATSAGSKLRVLVVLGDDGNEGPRGAVYISGKDGFYSELLGMLGARNVHDGLTMSVPTVSAEGVIALDPDVVVIVSSSQLTDAERREMVQPWREVPGFSAGARGAVVVLDQDFMTIPGPRYVMALRELSLVLRSAANSSRVL